MNWNRVIRLCVLAACAAALHAQCGGHGTQETMLVSAKWLAEHLKDPNLVILTVGQKADYDQGHIPGALYLNRSEISTPQGEGLTLELPPMAQVQEAFEKLGAKNTSHIILYFANNMMLSATTRVFLTLDAMGLGAHTSILDGGFPVWQKEGREVSTETPKPVRGQLQLCPQTDVIVDVDYVRSNLHHPGVDIVDARNAEYYTGASTAPGKRSGHIPGASNLTFSTLADSDGKFKPPDALRQMVANAGVKPGDRVVSYCHIGQQATVVYFVARYLGFDARLYDGSWEDWSAHKELPTEVSASQAK